MKLIKRLGESINKQKINLNFLKKIKTNTYPKLKLQLLNEISNETCKLIDGCLVLQNFQKQKQDQDILGNHIAQVSQFFQDLNHDQSMYQIIQELYQQYNSRQHPQLSSHDYDFICLLLQDYEKRYMIHDPSKLPELKSLQNYELTLTNIFLQNIYDDSNFIPIKLSNEQIHSIALPPKTYFQYIKSMNREDNFIEFQIPYKKCLQLMQNSMEPSSREYLFTRYIDSNKKNQENLLKLLKIRQQISIQFGFTNYVDYSLCLNTKYFNQFKISQIQDILTNKLNQIHDNLQNSLKDLSKIQNQHIKTLIQKQLQQQNSQYQQNEDITNLQNNSNNNIDDLNISQIRLQDLYYFKYQLYSRIQDYFGFENNLKIENCLEIITFLFKKLFNLDLIIDQKPDILQTFYLENAPQRPIYTLTVLENEQIQGIIFLDIFNQDTQNFEFRYLQGHYKNNLLEQIPHFYIKGGLPEKQQDFTIDFLRQLLHETGHAMHSLLFKHEYQLVSNNIKFDQAELCSVLFENFFHILPTLDTQNQFGFITSLLKNKDFIIIENIFSQIEILESIYFSFIDINFHIQNNEQLNATNIHNLAQEISQNVFKQFLDQSQNHQNKHNNYIYCNFDQITNYGGFFFIYPFCQLIASQILSIYSKNPEKIILKDIFKLKLDSEEINNIFLL